MNHIFIIHSAVLGHLGWYCVLAIVNSAAVSIGSHVSFWIMVFLTYMPSSRIAGSCGSSVFNFLRNLHTLLLSVCTQFTFPPTTQEHSLLYIPSSASIIFRFFFMVVILTSVRWCIILVLIYISVIINGISQRKH